MFRIIALRIFFAAFFLPLQSCNLSDSVEQPQSSDLKLLNTYDLSIPEPSGLSLNADRSALWTVSDNTNRIYSVSLEGELIDELRYEGNDLEGIVFDSLRNCLWLAEEQLREVVQVDLNGKELIRYSINLPGSGNSGLEGICMDDLHSFYLLNEKNPRLWAKLNNDFSTSLQKSIDDVDDLSGITYDANRNMFWIVSDQSQLLFLWDPVQGMFVSYDLPFEKAEGVAYDPDLNRMYIVSDKTAKLYVYDLPKNN
ncbi:MAG TPA: hypothetical protein ENK44_03205 [Caldithrix abyssi]|uniref:SMP-30/Gluconolactonase/LRE-like region domain-containing protein n=1 Tax=Caldithrix abyssi TaxID=187145 RepID=A0A7V4TZU9_CALAY|nr:hypothetical protein [Caldithrix abyssi]